MPPRTQRRRRQPRPDNRQHSTTMSPRTLQLVANPTNRISAVFAANLSLSSAETVYTIGSKDLLYIPGGVALTTTSLGAIAQSARLKCVEVWITGTASASTPNYVAPACGIAWYDGGERSSGQVSMNASLSSAFPARVCATPPRNSLNSMWFASSLANSMFDLIFHSPASLTLSVMVKVTLDWVASNQSYVNQNITTASTLSVGNVYYTPLDGVSSHTFVRMGLPYTF